MSPRTTMRVLLFLSLTVFACGVAAVVAYLVLRDTQSEPGGRVAFAAGGSIYVIDADGSNLRRVVEGERKDAIWASSPAFSLDGDRIAFARDFDIWIVDADGGNVGHLDVAEYVPSPGASNWSVGVTNLSWSPDGEQLLFGTSRVGGSGLGYVERINVDGSGRIELRQWNSAFLVAQWAPDGSIVMAGDRNEVSVLDPDGASLADVTLGGAWPSLVATDGVGRWLVAGFANEGAILYGKPEEMREVATGVSPALSPDGGWIAYLQGESIRLVRTDRSDDRLLVDLESLGGRDHHFAAQPDCYPDRLPSCSYRPPMLSWTGTER